MKPDLNTFCEGIKANRIICMQLKTENLKRLAKIQEIEYPG